LNFILIPKYNALGASIALIVSESTLIIGSLPIIRRYVSLSWSKILLPKIILLTALLFIFIYAISALNIFIIILLSIILYPVLIIILKILSISEIKQYINAFKGKTEPGNTNNQKI
jgi:O-antigen/teichoic acid export membrane protein